MSFALTWILIGSIHLLGTSLVESHLASQNPEHLQRLRKTSGRGESITIPAIVLFILLWPFMLYLTIRATMKNMSVLELLASDADERGKKRGPMWVDREGDGFKISILIRPYLENGKWVYRLTHMLFRTEGNPVVGGWRTPFSEIDAEKITEFFMQEHQSPDLLLGDFSQAKAFCEQDTSWMEVCAPGRERERAARWMLMKDSSR